MRYSKKRKRRDRKILNERLIEEEKEEKGTTPSRVVVCLFAGHVNTAASVISHGPVRTPIAAVGKMSRSVRYAADRTGLSLALEISPRPGRNVSQR